MELEGAAERHGPPYLSLLLFFGVVAISKVSFLRTFSAQVASSPSQSLETASYDGGKPGPTIAKTGAPTLFFIILRLLDKVTCSNAARNVAAKPYAASTRTGGTGVVHQTRCTRRVSPRRMHHLRLTDLGIVRQAHGEDILRRSGLQHTASPWYASPTSSPWCSRRKAAAQHHVDL